jgi:hypothetical protein
MDFSKEFKKGEELGPELDKFIMDSLMKVTTVKQIPGGYPHDKIVKFNRSVVVNIQVVEVG